MTTHTDPVCGMPVSEEQGSLHTDGTDRFWFCSEFCKQEFLRHPRAYTEAPVVSPSVVEWGSRRVAYFSMEVALSNAMPTYSGGLGVLAGDTLRSCADLGVPIVGVSLVHRRGYFRQEIRDDWQIEHDAPWEPEGVLQQVGPAVTVSIEGRTVRLRAWRYDILGSGGYVVPVLLLDTHVSENEHDDRHITDYLYGGDERYRLAQEIVLGVGGVRVLEAVGCTGLRTFHLNEGHAALAPLELLRKEDETDGWDFRAVRNRTVFTTHTPVAAGHDQFDTALASRVLGSLTSGAVLKMLGGAERLNMTHLALNLSHYVNGVALRHREVSTELFPRYEIHQITNGVHATTWTSAPFKTLFDRYVPGWRDDPLMLHNALALPEDDIWEAHLRSKAALIEVVLQRTGRRLLKDALTVGFARRATGYKRSGLVLSDIETLRRIAAKHPLQLIFAGKAHRNDEPGKQGIRSILQVARQLADALPVVYLPEYDVELALNMVGGVDLWLNTPLRPLEASGTSGMKAALNGVPSFSVLDGWWREGCVEGVTGWSIGAPEAVSGDEAWRVDAADLYRKLETVIAPLFYTDRSAWVRIMRHCIALNGSFFNSHRMVRQYMSHAYSLDETG